MVRRYRETCLNAYLNRRQRSLGYVYNGGMPGNIYSNPELGTSILFQDAWSFAVAGSGLGGNFNPAKWASTTYFLGADPGFQYDGLGNIVGIAAAGPPGMRIVSVPIVYNIDKPHSILLENVGLGSLSSAAAGAGSVVAGIESNSNSTSNPDTFFSVQTGLAVNHSDAAQVCNVHGVNTTFTGAQYFLSGGGALKIVYGRWNGTNRDVWFYLNGSLLNHQVSTTQGIVGNKQVKLTMGTSDRSIAPTITFGRVTFKGFST